LVSTILFLGPCRKFDPATSKPFAAFSPNSRSGKFLRSAIDATAASSDIAIHHEGSMAVFVWLTR
jgi:hypothetical protein